MEFNPDFIVRMIPKVEWAALLEAADPKGRPERSGGQPGARHVSHTPAACSFPGEKARSWEALGEARPGQSSLSAGAMRYRAWAQSWSSAALAARSVLPSNRSATPLFLPACWELGFQAS